MLGLVNVTYLFGFQTLLLVQRKFNHLCSKAGCHRFMDKQLYRLVEINLRKMTWLREVPDSLHNYLLWETSIGIQGNDLGHSNIVKDWIIRRLEPNSVMIGHGSVSETAKASVLNDGLINLKVLKVQSSLLRNKWDKRPWGGLAYSN